MTTHSPQEPTDAEDSSTSASDDHLQIHCENIAWSRREYTRKQAFRAALEAAAEGELQELALQRLRQRL